MVLPGGGYWDRKEGTPKAETAGDVNSAGVGGVDGLLASSGLLLGPIYLHLPSLRDTREGYLSQEQCWTGGHPESSNAPAPPLSTLQHWCRVWSPQQHSQRASGEFSNTWGLERRGLHPEAPIWRPPASPPESNFSCTLPCTLAPLKRSESYPFVQPQLNHHSNPSSPTY